MICDTTNNIDNPCTVGEPATTFSYKKGFGRLKDVLRSIMKQPIPEGGRLNFLDLGGRDGRLKILLGRSQGKYDKELHRKNYKSFNKKYVYTGCDLKPGSDNVIPGDLCDEDYLENNTKYVG